MIFKDILATSLSIYIVAKLYVIVHIFLGNILFGQSEEFTAAFFYYTGERIPAIKLIFALVISPVCETLIFCTIVWHMCQRFSAHKYVYVLWSGVTFGLAHVMQLGGSYTFGTAAVAGFGLAILYYKYANNFVSAVAIVSLSHSIINGLLFLEYIYFNLY